MLTLAWSALARQAISFTVAVKKMEIRLSVWAAGVFIMRWRCWRSLTSRPTEAFTLTSRHMKVVDHQHCVAYIGEHAHYNPHWRSEGSVQWCYWPLIGQRKRQNWFGGFGPRGSQEKKSDIRYKKKRKKITNKTKLLQNRTWKSDLCLHIVDELNELKLSSANRSHYETLFICHLFNVLWVHLKTFKQRLLDSELLGDGPQRTGIGTNHVRELSGSLNASTKLQTVFIWNHQYLPTRRPKYSAI